MTIQKLTKVILNDEITKDFNFILVLSGLQIFIIKMCYLGSNFKIK